ncbi:hypothetical protein ACLOJK_011295 [Asimina triloba]
MCWKEKKRKGEEMREGETEMSRVEAARGDFAQDGSVDLKGNPVLRSKRGGLKACSFVVVSNQMRAVANGKLTYGKLLSSPVLSVAAPAVFCAKTILIIPSRAWKLDSEIGEVALYVTGLLLDLKAQYRVYPSLPAIYALYEVFERMAFYGIQSNLVVYMTEKLHQGTVASSNSVTNWVGTIWITPVLGAYVADAHLGRYWTFIIASCVYLSVTAFTHLNSQIFKAGRQAGLFK